MPWHSWKDALRALAWDAPGHILRHIGPPPPGRSSPYVTADGRRLSTEAVLACAIALRVIDGGAPPDLAYRAALHFSYRGDPPAPPPNRRLGDRDVPPGRARMPGQPFAEGRTWLAHLAVGRGGLVPGAEPFAYVSDADPALAGPRGFDLARVAQLVAARAGCKHPAPPLVQVDVSAICEHLAHRFRLFGWGWTPSPAELHRRRLAGEG